MDLSDQVKRGIAAMMVDEEIHNDLKALLSKPEVLEIMAQAHDQEEAAQKGEPSPWRADLGADQDPEWRSERRTAMLCALQAVGLA